MNMTKNCKVYSKRLDKFITEPVDVETAHKYKNFNKEDYFIIFGVKEGDNYKFTKPEKK